MKEKIKARPFMAKHNFIFDPQEATGRPHYEAHYDNQVILFTTHYVQCKNMYMYMYFFTLQKYIYYTSQMHA